MTHWLNDSLTDQLDLDDDEELSNEWGISSNYASASGPNKSSSKATKVNKHTMEDVLVT